MRWIAFLLFSLAPVLNAAWWWEVIGLDYDDEFLVAPSYLGELPPTFLVVNDEGYLERYSYDGDSWYLRNWFYNQRVYGKPAMSYVSDNTFLIAFKTSNQLVVLRQDDVSVVVSEAVYDLDLGDVELNSIVGHSVGNDYLLTGNAWQYDRDIYCLNGEEAVLLPKLPDFSYMRNIALTPDGRVSLLYGTHSPFSTALQVKVGVYTEELGWETTTVPLGSAVQDGFLSGIPLWHGYDRNGDVVVYGYINRDLDYPPAPYPLWQHEVTNFIARRDSEGDWHFTTWPGQQVNPRICAAFTPDNILQIVANMYPGQQFVGNELHYAEYDEYLTYDGETVTQEPVQSVNFISYGTPYSFDELGGVYAIEDDVMHYRTTPVEDPVQPFLKFFEDGMEVSWTAEQGYRYTVQYSYDMENWFTYDLVYYGNEQGETLSTVFAPKTFLPFIESVSMTPMFMRVVAHP